MPSASGDCRPIPARPLKTSYPELGARIHANTPDKFLHALVDAIKDGKGSPKLVNDEFLIPWFLSNGIPMREALDYAISGCTESRLPNRETGKTGNSGINYGALVEMTLRDGKMKFWKDAQFGVKTGDPRTFKTFDDVWTAFRLQTENVVKHCMIQKYVALSLKAKYNAAPLCSMVHDLCMEQGRDIHTHGEYFPGALDACCLDGVGGFATAIDSLAAVKHLIFDTKRLTWDQLLEALECNWEGKEAIRQLCLHAPKYGNGIEWVDNIGYQIQRVVMEYSHNHPKPHGQSFNMRIIPVTFHVPCGMVTMATQWQNEFELHARAILGLPVSTKLRNGGASAVIYGQLEEKGIAFEDVDKALRVPDTELRLFGKPESFERRRMGVALAYGEDLQNARERARLAASLVKPVKG